MGNILVCICTCHVLLGLSWLLHVILAEGIHIVGGFTDVATMLLFLRHVLQSTRGKIIQSPVPLPSPNV